MNKKEFLKHLKSNLKGLPSGERREHLSFYSEIIDDKIEEGATENAAILEIGAPEDIARGILAERGDSEKDIARKSRGLSGAEIALVIIGSPIWVPLLLAAGAIILAVYLVAYALLLSLWIIEAPFLIMSLISRALVPACVGATKGLAKLTSASFKGIGRPFRR